MEKPMRVSRTASSMKEAGQVDVLGFSISHPDRVVFKDVGITNGKIFVDYFRNDYTATAIADFSVRARPGAPVAVPLEWSELDALRAGNQFTIKDVLKRFGQRRSGSARAAETQKLPLRMSDGCGRETSSNGGVRAEEELAIKL